MKLSPYQKAMEYWCVLCLLVLLIVGSVGLFMAHAEQAITYSVFILVSITLIGVMAIGYLRLRATRKEGKKRYWYQQMEITIGLAFCCLLLTFPTITIFDALFYAHPLKSVYYAEMGTLFFWSLLSLFFFGLGLKSKFDEEKK